MSFREEWLDGLEGGERGQRRALLARLIDDGFSPAEIEQAIAHDRLALLPVDRVFGASHTAREIEAETGLAADIYLGIRRLQGMPDAGPDDRVFSDEDVEAARSTKLFLDAGLGIESIEETAAVMAEGMSRLASTITAQFLQTFLVAGESEEEAATRFATLAEQLAPMFSPVLFAAFRVQLQASVGRGVLGRAELERGSRTAEQELAVCFVDLVGFTRLGREVEVLELGSVAGRLARLAGSVATPPVRLIKTIGDAAMFVSPDAGALVDAALALVERASEQDLPEVRAGIALGPVADRAGDYYGNTVNLASRVTGTARPSSVLCTREVRDAAPDAFDWSSTGRHRLKGVGRPVSLYRAHRLAGRGGDERS